MRSAKRELEQLQEKTLCANQQVLLLNLEGVGVFNNLTRESEET